MSSRQQNRCRTALHRAEAALRGLQHDDGHFCGELQGDSILASEYLLMKFILAQEHQRLPDGSGPAALTRIGNWLRSMQRDDGSWGQGPGMPIDVSASVKAYFAMKLMGEPRDAPHMVAARETIRAAGGAEKCNSFTRFFLACLGQISWRAVPEIPPEVVFLPRWFLFHPDKMSAWSRTMILPLAIVSALRPTRPVPRELGIDELFVTTRDRHRMAPAGRGGDDRFSKVAARAFLAVDRGLKWMRLIGATPLRWLAIRRGLDWILDRAGSDGEHATDGFGAIFPPMVYLQIVLHALGYPRHHPLRRRAEADLDALFIHDGEMIRIQPCFSPVWDTGLATFALTECGHDVGDVRVRAATNWLRDRQCAFRGDWTANLDRPCPTDAAGWFFQYNNAWYPDVDDTAMVAMALNRAGGEANRTAARRGVSWMLALQNDDGGWAAFDRTRHRPLLESVPFADHNAMQDPSCPDITGRVLECLACHGYSLESDPVRRGIEFIKTRQEPEGCWFGRWGVNYIYGTWQAVVGPIRCGIPRGLPWLRRAGEWLKIVQMDDGSFGESPLTYEDPMLKGVGSSTASQTAWAAMTLLAIHGPSDPALQRAIDWLIETQLSEQDAVDPVRNPDGDPAGSWAETEFTGTGFPRVFYLRYHLYRLYFPLMAIARYVNAHGPDRDLPPKIEVVTRSMRSASQTVR